MALQVGAVNTSKVLILVGAGLTGSVVLRSGQLSSLIAQLQELLKGVYEVEISSGGYDATLLAAQIRQLAQEIRELTLSRPVIFNANSSSTGGFASYLLPAAAIGAMGYFYMWWKGWSFSDVMFVTKQNMANAVSTVSKQLENLHETLASTRRHLTKRLEGLDFKVEEHNELSQLISNDVNEVKSDLSQIGCDVELIHKMISGLEGKLKLVEGKQDITNSGLWYLCEFAEGLNDGPNGRVSKDIAEPTNRTPMTLEEKAVKGLQFIAKSTETVENSPIITKKLVGLNSSNEKLSVSSLLTYLSLFRRMKDAGKSHKANGKSSPEMRKDRKSATGMSGSPKKGGHGGKFTWIGHDDYSDLEIQHGAVDSKDPNFDDPEEIAAV